MNKKRNIIELNGKRYDANTGAVIGQAAFAAASPRSNAGANSIDGFTSTPQKLRPAAAQPKRQAAKPLSPPPKSLTSPKKIMSDIQRAPARHVSPRKPQPASTLMRQAVKKPKPSFKKSLKPQTRIDILAKAPSVTVTPKLSYVSIDEKRLNRAQTMARHKLVSRFGNIKAPASPVKIVKASPSATPKPSYAHLKPVYAAGGATASPSMDIFQQALERASSHKQPPVKPAKSARSHARSAKKSVLPKIAGVSAALAAVFVVTGFIAYLNMDTISLKIASSRAGFSAGMPAYKPSGYSVGGFVYNPGAVAIQYKDEDNHAFRLAQKTTTWDSEALRSDFVSNFGGDFQTIESGGRKIYIYGNNNATWVNNGVWYQIDNDGSLSSDELIKLASSV